MSAGTTTAQDRRFASASITHDVLGVVALVSLRIALPATTRAIDTMVVCALGAHVAASITTVFWARSPSEARLRSARTAALALAAVYLAALSFLAVSVAAFGAVFGPLTAGVSAVAAALAALVLAYGAAPAIVRLAWLGRRAGGAART